MTFDFSAGLVSFSAQTAAGEVTSHRTAVQYSAISSSETRLPAGVPPAALFDNPTGPVVVGDSLLAHASETQRLVSASFDYIRNIAGALPIDENDERVVDRLLAKRTGNLAIKPLRRREGK